MSNNLKKEFKKINKKYDDLDKAHASGLMTMAAHISANRLMMFFSNLTQYNQIDNPEPPLLTTGYENPLALYSKLSYNQIENKVIVVGKIIKNKYNYTLITYDKKKDLYDIVERHEAEDLGESYGFKINNETIDSYNIGNTIKKDTVLWKSSGYDDYMNYGYGKNLNTMYSINLNNLEDAITTTDDIGLDTNKVKTIEVIISDNTGPLNLYGDNKQFKVFPEVGETVNDCILCATRLRNEKSDLFNFTNDKLRKLISGDTTYVTHGNYKVIDIDILTNNPIDDLPNTKSYQQIKRVYSEIIEYRKKIHKELDIIINSGSDYTSRLSFLYKRINDLLDDRIKIEVNNKIFSKFIINFTVMHKDTPKLGSKIVGRSGNKGIIGTIRNKKEASYYIDEKGEEQKVQIILDGLGILARLALMQSYEVEVNWMVGQALDRVWDDRKKFMKTCFDLLNILNPSEAEALENDYMNLDKSGKKYIYKSIQEHGLPIFVKPSEGIGDKRYEELIDYVKPKKYKIYKYDTNGKKIYYKRPMIVGKQYVMILKHTPLSKFSVRSRGAVNPRSGTPTRSNAFLKNRALYSDTSSRLGEFLPTTF